LADRGFARLAYLAGYGRFRYRDYPSHPGEFAASRPRPQFGDVQRFDEIADFLGSNNDGSLVDR
jgi:hypothetical protein